ncbi:MAG: ATP-binding protein [Pyrinomonadaceae bacterium]
MSFFGILNLVGYSLGAALYLWMAALIWPRKRLNRLERVLLVLSVTVGAWHAANLGLTLHALLGLQRGTWSIALRLADTIAVVAVTLCYSLLLHIHLHLWAQARTRSLTFTEKARVLMSYIPILFLVNAVPRIWLGEYQPMLEKLSNLVLPFALWSAYVMFLIAGTELLIARITSSRQERRLMWVMASSFISIAILMILVHAFGIASGTIINLYLQSIANLGSLLPSALLAYYIYRYRYLELAIKESLVVASFAAVVLVIYLFGIRTFGAWLTESWELNPGSVEALLILALALVAAPLRRWLDHRFHRLFEREAAIYRDVVARIGVRAGEHKSLTEMIDYVEQSTAQALLLSRVQILIATPSAAEGDVDAQWTDRILQQSREANWMPLENDPSVRERGFDVAYSLRREGREVGLMLIGAGGGKLTAEVRAVLEVLAAQVAVAIEERRLIEENVQLERKLAHGERLAALGQMAATIAHEVKNPLSSIKSIAQVMGEDTELRSEYGRDLDLIVGETDRLSRSVTQLLNFARRAPVISEHASLDIVLRTIIDLFSADAARAGVKLELRSSVNAELRSEVIGAVRDALSNLLLNSIQATPAGGRVLIESDVRGGSAHLLVTDAGGGIPPALQDKIWEPFFTTKQRGTGLGLAIVKRRMEEVGGRALLLGSDLNKRRARVRRDL